MIDVSLDPIYRYSVFDIQNWIPVNSMVCDSCSMNAIIYFLEYIDQFQ